jgi:integrase
MATVRKVGNYQYEALVRRKVNGRTYSTSKTFPFKKDAEEWSREVETQIKNGTWKDPRTQIKVEVETLKDALSKYSTEVSSLQKGHKQQLVRLKKWEDHKLAKMRLEDITGQHIASHRDERRKEGRAENTIRLELTLLSRVFETARTEWGLPNLRNPTKDIKMPTGSKKRDRRCSDKEFNAILDELKKGCRNQDIPRVWEFALRTGARQSELIGKDMPITSQLASTSGLVWEDVDFKTKTALLRDTKNPSGEVKDRVIPLLPPAFDFLKSLPRPLDGGRIFNVTQDGLIRAVSAAATRAELHGITFHVLRHEFTTRMIEAGWGMAEVQATTGHSTAEMLRRYTHVAAKDIAAKAASSKS